MLKSLNINGLNTHMEIKYLIDFEKVDSLLDRFNKTTGFVTAILDLDGNVLSKSGWRQICTEFHRKNPETSKKCTLSDTELANKMAEGEKYHLYKCLNGLIDVAVPLIIKGEHVANLFSGQFFLEKPDTTFFKKQAKEFGFDEKKYLDALSKVPILSEKKVRAALDFLLEMAQLIGDMALQKAEHEDLNQKIRLGEKKHELFFESTSIGLALTRMDGKLVDVNPAYAAIIGRTVEETKQLTYWDITPKEYYGQEQKQLESLEKTGRYGPYKKEYIHKNGQLVPVRLQGFIIEREGQKYIWSSVEDITEPEKAVEEQLKLLNIIEQSRNEIYVFNENTLHFEFLNHGALENLGYTLSEIKGMTPFDIKPETSEDAFRKMIKPLQDDLKDRLIFETVHQRKNGSTYPVEVYLQLQKYDNKNLFLAVIIDITERKSIEEALHIKNKVFESSIASQSIADKEGIIRYVNPAFLKMWGYSTLEQAIGNSVGSFFVNPSDAEPVLDSLTKSDVWEGEFLAKTFDGLTFISHGYATSLRNADGVLIGYQSTNLDVTKEREAEKKLKASIQRAAAQRSALTKLALDKSLSGENTNTAFQRVVEIISEALSVARASVWVLKENDSRLQCISLYQANSKTHIQGEILKPTEIPSYFNAIKSGNRIYADDAQNDQRTRELNESYLKPLNITSLLDTGIFIDGRLIGVVSSEHIGPKRKWYPDEEFFISTVAAIVAQIFLNAERKQAERALKESEERNRALLDAIPDILFVLSKEGFFIDYNFNNPEKLLLTPESFLNKHVSDVLPSKLASLTIDKLKNVFQTQQTQFYEYDLKIGAELRYYDARLVFSSENSALCIIRDITDRKLAEEQLKQKSEKLTALLEISALLADSHNTRELFQKTTDGTARLFPKGSAAIYLVQDEKTLYLASTTPALPLDFPEQLRSLPLSVHPHIRRAIESGSPVILSDTHTETLTEAEQEAIDQRGLRSLLFLPLMHQGKSLGVLIVGSVENLHHFTHEEKDLFSTLANQASLEIEGTRLVEENLSHILNLERLLEEQNQMQKALRESEERYRNIFETAPMGIGISLKGKSVLVNPAMVQIFGANTQDQMIGKDITGFVHPDNRLESIKRLQLLMNGEKGLYPHEDRCIRLDEEIIDVEVMATLLTYQNQPAVQVIITDITERKRMRQVMEKLNAELEMKVEQRTAQLEVTNKELEAFSYSVSHDLRAPLRHINGFVDLLNQRYHDHLPEKARHYMDTISRASRQMSKLIDELLNFSRTGRKEVKKTLLDMNRLVKEVKEEMKTATKGRKIKWDIQDLPMVSGDYNLLKLVWANLLDNAVKYTRKQKAAEITISFKEEPKKYVFCICDNGVGFDMKYAHKLFGVFQRLHTLAEFEGTGIGLANVQRIVNKHSGRVWAEAEPENGAKFYFSLPI